MISRPNLDTDALRTFVAGVDLGSFAKAAAQVGRSPAAVSQQMQKLERQVGCPLLERRGRSLVPTAAGETVLAYARRLLALNDEAVASVRGRQMQGQVRLGLVHDFAEATLPPALGAFSRSHPQVRLETLVDGSSALEEAVARGALDLALVWGEPALPDRAALLTRPMGWLAASGWTPAPGAPIPLVVLHLPCGFRAAACAALDRAGLPWRVAASGPSLGAAWAAVRAGLGVMPRTDIGAPADVAPVPDLQAAAPLPPVTAWLAGGAPPAPGSAAATLADALRATLAMAGNQICPPPVSR